MQAKQLEPGMKVKMADESVKTVGTVKRGFARIKLGDSTKQALMVCWTDMGWSQIHPETEVTLV